MSDRDTLVAALVRHNEDGTIPDVALLDALAPRTGYDVEAAVAVGTAHWQRFLTLPGAESDEALRLALDAWTTLALVEPGALPEHIARMLAASVDDPDVWYERAAEVLFTGLDRDDHALVFAIRLLRRIAGEAPDFPRRVTALSNLASALHSAGLRSESSDLLDEALRISHQTLAEEPADSETRLSTLGNHGAILFHHGDLEKAIEVLRDVWLTAPDDYPERSSFAYNLATAMAERYEVSGDPADLDEAIDAAGAAMLHTSPGKPSHLPRATMLAGLLAARDLPSEHDRIVELWDQVVTAAPQDPDRAGYLSALGGALRERYRRTHDLADIDRAILAGQQAIDAEPASDSLRFNLGVALVQRFEHIGDHTDLDRALDLLHDVHDRTGEEHPNRSARLSELAAALHVYYDRTGDIADLDLAVDLGERALAADPAHEAATHAELCILLSERFDVTGDDTDLASAVAHARHAVALARETERPAYVTRLAGYLVIRARHGHPEDLDEALTLLTGRVRESPEEPTAQARLGLAHLTRFDLDGDRAQLLQAADCFRACLRLRDPADVSRAGEAANLGRTLVDLDLLAEARDAFEAAATTAGADPSVRLSSADNWHRIAVATDDPRDAAAALTVAVGLMSDLAGRRIAPELRKARLTRIRGLASDAAALTLRAGDPRRALTLLEDGRGVLLAHALETHADDEALHAAHPELAERWRQLRHRLDAEIDWTPATTSQRRRALVVERDTLLAEIRAREGFDGFLHPAQVDELRPDGGTLVVVNTSRYGGDALLLTGSDLTTVELPALTTDTAAEQAARLREAVLARDWNSNDTVLDVLDWTWEAIVGPVLDRLTSSRVWWLPTGPVATLPLHAAGTALDDVTSSYTPTARTLRRARTRRVAADPGRALVVGLRHTPGQHPLPEAVTEAAAVARRWATGALVDEEAVRGPVLTGLQDATRAHFACHAISDGEDPADSHLLLHDGPLRVSDLMKLHLGNAELAYLSACSTADSGSLPDEAVHICSALHVAGFRHVVGTLWPIADDMARRMAELFYAQVDSHGPAGAIAMAAREIRAAYPANPLLWAAHLHVGP